MKTLLILTISLVTISASAEGSNFNCSAMANQDRHNSLCNSSLLSDANKISLNCASQVKQKGKKSQTVDDGN